MKGKILDLKINYEVWYEKVRFLLLKIGRFFLDVVKAYFSCS